MALTKEKKQAIVDEVSQLLADSKLTVVAKYEGTGVKPLQQLRRDARDNGTKVKVVKNRLVIQAIKGTEGLKSLDTSALEGMLLYAFNSDDEVAPAQILNNFAKANPTLQFVGAITAEGEFMAAESVKSLAVLPGKNQLIAGVIATLNAPLQGVVSGLSGDLHSLLMALEAKAPAAEVPAEPTKPSEEKSVEEAKAEAETEKTEEKPEVKEEPKEEAKE